MQNSGVTLEAESMHFASSKDNNPVMATISYCGVIEEIREVDFVKFRVPVFKCKWVDSNIGVQIDDLGFTLVDLGKIGYKEDPFIMTYQAKQFFMLKILQMRGDQLSSKGKMNLMSITMMIQ